MHHRNNNSNKQHRTLQTKIPTIIAYMSMWSNESCIINKLELKTGCNRSITKELNRLLAHAIMLMCENEIKTKTKARHQSQFETNTKNLNFHLRKM